MFRTFWNIDCVLSTNMGIFGSLLIHNHFKQHWENYQNHFQQHQGHQCQAISQFFPVCFWCLGRFEILIVISQLLWGVGDWRYRGSGGSIVGSDGWIIGGRGIVESNFIISCNFWIFLFFWRWWRWHKYCNFSTNMGIWRLYIQDIVHKPLGKQWKNRRGQWDSRKQRHRQFSCFSVFLGVGGNFDILITISQWIWGVGDCRVRVSVGSIFGSDLWSVGGRGIAESNFSINCNFWFFQFFLCHLHHHKKNRKTKNNNWF